MTFRLDPYDAAPAAMQAFFNFSQEVNDSGLEKPLLELVKIRASQLNGCANCLNMHTADAHKGGESAQRLHLLAAWEDAPCYSGRERAALAWTEYLTLLADRSAPDHVYDRLDAEFSKEEQVQLTLAINAINGWNRLAVGCDMFAPELGW